MDIQYYIYIYSSPLYLVLENKAIVKILCEIYTNLALLIIFQLIDCV